LQKSFPRVFYFPVVLEVKMKLRLLTYFICLIGACLSCACGKRKMTPDDEKTALAIVEKYDQAQYAGDLSAMLDRADELLDFSRRFEMDEMSRSVRVLGWLRRGETYLELEQTERAEADYDAIIRETNVYRELIRAYIAKILLRTQSNCKLEGRVEDFAKTVFDMLDEVKKKKQYQEDPELQSEFLAHYGDLVFVYGMYLQLQTHEYDRAEKLYLDYFSQFKTDEEFLRVYFMAPVLYYYLAHVYRKKKDFVREEVWLKRSLELTVGNKKVAAYPGIFLRNAGCAIRAGDFNKALEYCDRGLQLKPYFPSMAFKQLYYDMLWTGKEMIYRRMGQQEKAKECAGRIRGKLNSDQQEELQVFLFEFVNSQTKTF